MKYRRPVVKSDEIWNQTYPNPNSGISRIRRVPSVIYLYILYIYIYIYIRRVRSVRGKAHSALLLYWRRLYWPSVFRYIFLNIFFKKNALSALLLYWRSLYYWPSVFHFIFWFIWFSKALCPPSSLGSTDALCTLLIYMYICMYVCIYISIYIHIYI